MRKEASHRPISDSYLAKLILYHLSFLPTGLVLGNFAPQGYDVAHLTPIDKPDWTCEARAVEGARRLEEAKKRPEMMVARASMFMGQLELSLYLQTSISAWTSSCDSCDSLCWMDLQSIAFLQHGQSFAFKHRNYAVHHPIDIQAWIRYVAMSQMQRKQNDLEQSRLDGWTGRIQLR